MKCVLIKDEPIYLINASVMLVIYNSTNRMLADMFINILYLSEWLWVICDITVFPTMILRWSAHGRHQCFISKEGQPENLLTNFYLCSLSLLSLITQEYIGQNHFQLSILIFDTYIYVCVHVCKMSSVLPSVGAHGPASVK